MTVLKPSLAEVYQRWREANPVQTASGNTVPDGYRHCHWPDCRVLIAEGQERVFCYGHGGKPNKHPLVRMPAIEVTDRRRSVSIDNRSRRQT